MNSHLIQIPFRSPQYIGPFFDVLNEYTSRGGAIVDVYFRNEDQSSIVIQDQMEDFVNELVDMEQIDNQPAFFWLRDFRSFLEVNEALQSLPFNEQFEAFYNDPIFYNLYADHIVLDASGAITASRTTVYMNNINDEIVTEVIAALEDQRAISAQQPVNHGKEDWSFFTYSEVYFIWEFYSVAVDELTLTTILGVVAVSVLSTIFMPHSTAFFFVAPLICVLYVDLLGVLQFAGISINPVSYISLVMSIGLLVDFIVHVLLRYYEVQGDRATRTKEMLRTMGSSVMLGGISTFLGVLPLAFSSSTIFFTIFVAFLALVTLGIGHGLILLPVLLSILGPESTKVEIITNEEGSLSGPTSSLALNA
jgi:predicted RND superfamily exporter protein